MLDQLRSVLSGRRIARLVKQSPYRQALGDLPEQLYPYWAHSAGREFPDIARDSVFFTRASEGLLTFFDCVRHSKTPCGLPSRAADSVWHAWERNSPASLEAFCRKHFGRTIAHRPAAAMPVPTEQALAATLVQARRLQGLHPAGPNLPALFTLDSRLGMPHGNGYRVERGQIGFTPLDREGRAAGSLFYPDSLTPLALLGAGLIARHVYDDYEETVRRAQVADAGGSGATGGAHGEGDSGGDGGGEGGGEGGGCGGGCGGGGD